ncbi:MAG: fatty acid desaturase [Sandaracinaceae bacterium]|nr:fatty acid desaturase [Sandaracinaceae bacterium]
MTDAAVTQSPPRAIDLVAFAQDVDALRQELTSQLGPEDLAHFEKLERWGRRATQMGYATAWIAPNPFSALMLAVGSSARWAVVMHHVSHRGLDQVPGVPERLTSKRFARGGLRRRMLDWLDWVDPEAWNLEHNILHHYRTGETVDPDLVESHMEALREAKVPMAVKLGVVAFFAFTWRYTYYAPNTFQVLTATRRKEGRISAEKYAEAEPIETRVFSAFDPRTEGGRAFLKNIAPYALTRFVAAPLAFAPLGPGAVASVAMNTVMAEALSNLQTFCVITPNHAGDDLFRFDERPVGRAELYARQVLGSVNFTGGSDLADFLQGFLNYQIEHHLFPDLPPKKLQEAQPRVEALCKKHGIPYVREPIHKRVKQLVDVMVGTRTMKRARTAADAAKQIDAERGVRSDA